MSEAGTWTSGRMSVEDSDGATPAEKPGLSLEKRVELEERKRLLLIKRINTRMFAVKEKEEKLKQLQKKPVMESVMEQQTDREEEACKKQIPELEISLEKMKVKISVAQKVNTTYRLIHDHLEQSVRDSYRQLEQRECAMAVGQANVEKLSRQLRSVAADTTQNRISCKKIAKQMRRREKEKKEKMESELLALTEQAKQLKTEMETLVCRMQQKGPDHLMEQETGEEEEQERQEAAAEGDTPPHQLTAGLQLLGICGASECDVKLVEEVEALRDTLGCVDVQDLVNRVKSQQAVSEQLRAQIPKCEETLAHMSQTLVDLESRYAELKFCRKSAAMRFDSQKKDLQSRLDQERDGAQRKQDELRQLQDLKETVDQGVNNLYFRMSGVPVEGLQSGSVSDSLDKLRDIRARLPTLQQRSSQQEDKLDQEKLYSLLEELNALEPRNNKRPTTPMDDPQLEDDDEDKSFPSREDIKRSSRQLIESQYIKQGRRTTRQ